MALERIVVDNVDSAGSQLEGLAVVVLVEQQANDLQMLGSCNERERESEMLYMRINKVTNFSFIAIMITNCPQSKKPNHTEPIHCYASMHNKIVFYFFSNSRSHFISNKC